MAEDDIYHNEARYEKFKKNLDDLFNPPTEDEKRKYWCKNRVNKKYFEKLFNKFEARDNSYIRRLRLLRTFIIINYVLDMDLVKVERDDIDKVMAYSHTVNKSPKSKRDFALDTKFLWRQLFPEKDEKGRIDETLTPYAVRHLSGKIDKSKEKLRGDKFSFDEYERLLQAFSDDERMQCLLAVTLESLARPQELLGRKIKNVELHDNYAMIYITEHGKEGTGFLRIIDSYVYLARWLDKHPMKGDNEAYLFVNTGRVNRYKQMTPYGANKLIRNRCEKIGINKPITLYSLKRNGVTMMRLQGKSDLDIQHTARWTSTKQLKTYDLSNQEESFKIELIKRGIIKADEQHKQFAPVNKKCLFCGTSNALTDTICSKCSRLLDREAIEKEADAKKKELDTLKKQVDDIPSKILSQLANLPELQEALKLISEKKKKLGREE